MNLLLFLNDYLNKINEKSAKKSFLMFKPPPPPTTINKSDWN